MRMSAADPVHTLDRLNDVGLTLSLVAASALDDHFSSRIIPPPFDHCRSHGDRHEQTRLYESPLWITQKVDVRALPLRQSMGSAPPIGITPGDHHGHELLPHRRRHHPPCSHCQ